MKQLPALTPLETQRYSRHLILPEVGIEGQKRLKAASVLVVGAGGLGSPACMYLAAAGIGTIGIVDFDAVELSNLQRQIVHSSDEVGQPKTQSARRRIAGLNPDVAVNLHEDRLSASNVIAIVNQYDVVLDGTDNFATRYLVNDACVLSGKPNVYGSIFRFEGQASVFFPPEGPCYRCLFPDPPDPDAIPNCAEGGVLGVLAGVIGVIQATEAIKLVLGLGKTLIGRLLLYDATEMDFDVLKLRRNPDCPVCGDRPSIKSVSDISASCAPAKSTEASDIREIEARQLRDRLQQPQPPFLLDVRNPEEHRLCHIEGAKLIPLPELHHRLGELDTNSEIVVYCKSGNRSRRAIELLQSSGFAKVQNLTGGILAWAKDVDSTMLSY
ncbi:MAG TPA: molybdopterin-synthase adenylyltransferase MoeB [Candidatus Obscuribacterales bacterium]